MKKKHLTHQQVMKKALADKNFKSLWEANQTKRDLAAIVIAERIKRKMTQEEFAKQAGLKQPSLARIESASVMPSIYTLEKIASSFGKSLQFRFI